MNLFFNKTLSENYKNSSQIARILTESWVGENIFCPSCGEAIQHYKNNKPIADFYCSKCTENYELKSKNGKKLGNTIPDGSYKEMLQAIQNESTPNFFFLNYDKTTYQVVNFLAVPSHIFMTNMIIPRSKGIPNRPDYIMCKIDISTIPNSGKIFYIKDKKQESKNSILEEWSKTLFLRNSKTQQKGWLLDTMAIIDKLDKKSFSLNELYIFESILRQKHPKNNNIQAKLRQQLQILRDNGYLKFTARGNYQLL